MDLFTGLAQSYGHILFMHRVIKNTVWMPKVQCDLTVIGGCHQVTLPLPLSWSLQRAGRSGLTGLRVMPPAFRSVLGNVFFCFLWAASVPEIPQRVGHVCLTLISSQVRAEMFISVNRVIPISREEMTHWVSLLSALWGCLCWIENDSVYCCGFKVTGI